MVRSWDQLRPAHLRRATRRRAGLVSACLAAWCLAVAGFAQSETQTKPATPDDGPNKPAPIERAEPASDAERISRMQRGIRDAQRQLKKLRAAFDSPDSEYNAADAEFTTLDRERTAARKKLQQVTEAGADPGEIEQRRRALDDIEARWKIARERFDLAIDERKTQTAQMAALERKVQQDEEALRRLKGEPATRPATTQPEATGPNEPAGPQPAPPTGAPAPGPAAPAPAAPQAPTAAPIGSQTPALITPPAVEETRELAAARQEAQTKTVAAVQAEQEARSAEDRVKALRESIALEQKLLGTARERANNARDAEALREGELEARWTGGATPAELAPVRASLAEERKRLRDAEVDVAKRTDRLSELQGELATVQSEHIAALEKAEAVRRDAQTAQRRVEQLESPLAPHNLWRWLVERGPRVGGIVVGMAAVLLLSRFAEKRFMYLLTRGGDRGSHEERENRAQTLVGVFHSAVSAAVYAGGVLMLLTELGVNIVPLMGGAAVAGLAVAFGAQNLIRDYFTGFMILLENQYGINDVVRVGNLAGLVERVTLRVTVLRDIDGSVHFVPNGQISSVTNMTHGWSRALLDVAVAYKEDVDRVMEVLIEIAKELRRDPEFRGMIIETPEMLGVDELGDSAVVVRLLIKTRPLRQWTVKREMLRRIKKRFDELGIEIPFPHRTVFQHVIPTEPQEVIKP